MKDLRIVSDLPDETVGYHLKQAVRSLNHTGTRLTDFHSAEVWMTDNPEVNYLCLIKDNVILFMVRFVRIRGLGDGQQILLLSNAKPEFVPLVQKFAIFAVLKILLPKYHILLPDKEMTASGIKMYKGLVATGMGRDRFAYWYDGQPDPSKWAQLSYHRDLLISYRMPVAISDKEFPKDKLTG
jgi:hypothetical protein